MINTTFQLETPSWALPPHKLRILTCYDPSLSGSFWDMVGVLCAGMSSSASNPSVIPNPSVCSAHRLLLSPHMALRPIQVPANEPPTILWRIQAPHGRTLPSPSPGLRTEHSLQYTYIMSLPLITVYSVGNAVIKYQEGFVFDSQAGGERALLLLVLEPLIEASQ